MQDLAHLSGESIECFIHLLPPGKELFFTSFGKGLLV